MLNSNSNQFVHSKLLYACDISQNSTIENQKIIIGTIGPGQQEIIKLQSTAEGYKSKSYILGNAFSAKLSFITFNDINERFISAGEKLQIFKSEEMKINHIADLIPLSKEYIGPTFCFDFHNQQINKLVSGSLDPTIRIWDLERKKCQYQFIAYNLTENIEQPYTLDLQFGDDINSFAFLSNESQIALYDMRIKMGVTKIQGKLQYNQLLWKSDNNIAVIDYETGLIDLFDLRETKRMYQRIRDDHQQIVKACQFKQQNAIVTARVDRKIVLYEEQQKTMESTYCLNKNYDIDNLCCQNNLFGVVSEHKFEIFAFETQ